MSKTRISVIGYPRIGSLRELKFASEKYFAKEISQEELNKVAHELKLSNWHTQKNDGIDFISSNDFSFYDGMLDTAFMLGAIPERYKKLGLSKLDTFFAMARGYQEGGNDVTALPMKKWFNTNYHYIVPEFDDSTELALDATKILEEFNEAKETGTETKINVIGPYTFLKLAHYKGTKNLSAYAEKAANLYKELLAKAAEAGAKWVQIEEPALVHDTTADDRVLFEKLYKIVLDGKKLSVLLETYFGDIRDSYKTVTELPFDAIGLDFIEGKETLNLLQKEGFPKDKILFAGVVNGKNIWKNNYAKTIELVNKIKAATEAEVVLSTSCSLLHVPYTIRNEIKLSSDILKHFSFAREKLPLRHSDWHTEYLDWAIPAFRLVHSGVRPETQIHTHMCYSEFNDIIKDIDNMDADVITFEASRGDLTILSALKENNFRTQVGPGVYDIHSPRVPTVEEIVSAVKKMENYVPKQKLWINPDCGLKTRGEKETVASLKNLVAAAKIVRNE